MLELQHDKFCDEESALTVLSLNLCSTGFQLHVNEVV